ncbi:apolipoprotein N-acyltransferase [Azospirillum baldaniorum]|uniref:apolipoprotein N-acyltransferase n=2 Tax=Azospirillum baldaniorum TaxID=1064539 RepID=UPI00119D9E13|nr:apolipoprotein N-acyltransferase [Azospirillum baldaniorum]TWA68514.1 apolipoprotein N-acyltransferase [Azospirillum baldaniorum]
MTATDMTTPPARLGRLSAGLAGLTGWRRLLAAAGFGGLAALALPPAGAVPLLLIAFPGLLWLLDGARTKRQAFAVGWFFGFGHHLLGLYWISAALFTDIERFWWALPLSAAGLPILLAMFTGFATLLVWVLRGRGMGQGLGKVVLFAASWALFEWLRGHVFTGFPWNLVGYGWTGFLPVLQGVSLIGIYGLSLLTVLVASLPAGLAEAAVPRRRAWGALAAGLALFTALGAWGGLRLAGASDAAVPGVRLRLVQPAIDQRLKWAAGERVRNVQQQMELSVSSSGEPVTHVIWAETAVPLFLDQDARLRQALGSVTPPGGLLITGVPRMEAGPEGEPLYYNSLAAVDGSGAVTGRFDKFHLVPFGEYMPLRRWLPVGAIAGNGAEFSAGPGPVSLDLKGLPPVSPLICYEVIFPGAVLPAAQDGAGRPRWMLNLTNDAWYGNTAGPYQHFAIARTRAVEEGMPLVRVANTGISGVVDAHGRITAMLPLGHRGVVDAALPEALPAPTLYGRVGDGAFGLLLLTCFAVGLRARHRS